MICHPKKYNEHYFLCKSLEINIPYTTSTMVAHVDLELPKREREAPRWKREDDGAWAFGSPTRMEVPDMWSPDAFNFNWVF